MGYRDDLYSVANIIGYTGTIQSDATVYFQSGQTFGHITQNHSIKQNVGREGVGQHQNYAIGNEQIDGAMKCVERIGPGEDGIIHVSRNLFHPVAGLSQLHLNLLARALLNFSEQKAINNLTIAEYTRLVEGDPILGGDVHRLVLHHERRIAVASL